MEIKLNLLFAVGYFLLVLGGHLNLFFATEERKVKYLNIIVK